MKVKVNNKLYVYEVSGDKTKPDKNIYIKVRNHWNLDSLVVIDTGDKSYTVSAEALKKAIENSQNS